MAGEIGDGGDHRGPGFRGLMLVRSVVAARVEAQRFGSVQGRNAAVAQIRFNEGTFDRLRHGEEPPCGLRRSGRYDGSTRSGSVELRIGMRQAEEGSSFIGDVLEVDQAAGFPDDVEQVAMLASGGVSPFAGGPLRRLPESHIH
jgi:hypothetical protein